MNSHKSGFFQETVEEYELVNASGELMTVTADSDRELFYALPWSCGALGFLTKLKVRVAPIKKYVELNPAKSNAPTPRRFAPTLLYPAAPPQTPHHAQHAQHPTTPPTRYVHMTYEITNSPAELCNRMTELSESAACHFLEATIFTKDKVHYTFQAF